MVEPSGSCSRAVCPSLPRHAAPAALVQQHQSGCTVAQGLEQDKQQQSAGMTPQQQQQQGQQQVTTPSITEQARSMHRLGGALQGVLSSGLATDFVEGLRPVMVGSTLQISTHIQLAGEAPPVFIGMFPTLQKAVDAQKQSQALVSKLPALIARSLIEAQLAHTQAVADITGAAPAAAAAGTGPHDAPCRLLSITSDTTGSAAPRFAARNEAAPDVPASELAVGSSAQQQEQQSAAPSEPEPSPAQQPVAAAAGKHGSGVSPAASVVQADDTTPIRAAGHAAAAGAADAAAAAAASHALTVSCQPLAALTDEVINLLLRKGLHALAVMQAGQGSAEAEAVPAAAGEQLQEAGAAGLAAAGGLSTQEDTPYTASGRGTASAPAAAAAAPDKADLAAAGLGGYHDQQQQQHVGNGRRLGEHDNAPAAAAAAAAGGYQGQCGACLDSLVEYAAPHTQQCAGSLQGMPPRAQLQDAAWAAAGYAAPANWTGYAAAAAGSAQLYAGHGAPAAAGAAAAGAAAAGSGGDLKRKRSDPRLSCIKSVQYRVSRFPRELHGVCGEHWERTRCARVVCNGVPGVMSVQGGRCVVSFSQHGQEVLKGVADYLRYAGEDRIKKWRRHVRMADFARPNSRTGELMTAEEFLCIVGYQSEQGGGKKPKYMGSAAEAAGSE